VHVKTPAAAVPAEHPDTVPAVKDEPATVIKSIATGLEAAFVLVQEPVVVHFEGAVEGQAVPQT